MQTKHTPGPWRLDGYTVYALDETGRINRFSANVQPGFIRTNSIHTQNVHTPDGEIRANALLIAAAPELLEALNAINALRVDRDADNIWSGLDRARKIATAAITKATGGAA